MTWDNLARPAPSRACTWERSSALDALPWCSHRMVGLYNYWDARRGVWSMPRRADIDPVEMRDWLSRIVLVDVVDGGAQFRYRVVGTALAELRGSDPTGLTVEVAWPAADAEIVLAAYRQVAAEKAPVFCHSAQRLGTDRHAGVSAVLLPLSNDGEQVGVILGYLAEGVGVLGMVL